MPECVRCGWCCRHELWCSYVLPVHGPEKHALYLQGKIVCPSLKWDGKQYACELFSDPQRGEFYRINACVGQGCFWPDNPDRKNIPPPKAVEEAKPNG